MKKTLLTTLLFSLLTTLAHAQTEVVGTVSDTTGTTLPGANAVLLKASDSLLVAFGTTDDKGVFRMQNVAAGEYLLRVSYVGFERPDQPLSLTSEDQYLDLGNIRLYPAGFLLGGVEVTADRIPIRMRGDTMMYDAASFAVSENAVVEDLLRRLPGMTVDASGNITWRGKPISEVMINGKPFFGGNTTLLTQNLDAKAVKNVRVFDQKSDNEEITGVDDGNENITVDLETKEEFKAKAFGDIYAGYGTQDRYQAGGKAFRISDATQWGLLGTINNINKVGFSGDEISGFNGSSGRGRYFSWQGGGQTDGLAYDNGNATGDNRSIAAGLNFGKTIGKDGQLTADYALFNRQQTQRSATLQTFNREGDDRIISTREDNEAASYRHSFGAQLRQKIDSVGRLRINANLSFLGSDNQDRALTSIQNSRSETVDYTVDDNTDITQPRGSLSGSYNTKLSRTIDRTLSVNVNGGYSENEEVIVLVADGLEEASNVPGALVEGRQLQDRNTYTTDFGAEVEYGEPLGEKWSLRLSAEYDYDLDNSDFDFAFDEQITRNELERTWSTVRPGVEIVRGTPTGGRFSFGADYLNGQLELMGDETREEGFSYVLPFASYRKRLKKGFFNLGLRSNANAPTINQLQTIARPSVSGFVNLGNPELTPSRSTNMYSFIWYNDQFRVISANANINVGYTDNAFGNSVTFTRGQQIFRTVNVTHAWNTNLNLNGTVGMAFINGQLELNAGANYRVGQGFVELMTQTNENISLDGGAQVTTELNEDSYLTVGYAINNFRNSFSDSERAAITQTTHSLTGDFGLELSPIWRLETRFSYFIYDPTASLPDGEEIADMRVSLELRPFKKKGHYVRLSGSDLFNQNLVINRNVNQFTTTENSATALGRYFLATFFYKL